MKVYIFDNKTKEYVGEDSAFWEPRGKIFLVPSNGTPIPPHPAVPKNYTQIFDKSLARWEIVPDYHGKEVFDVETQQFVTMTEIGELPESHFIVDVVTKQEYLQHPEYFDITPNGFVKKSSEELAKLDLEHLKQQKRDSRNAILSDVDWRIQRALDAGILQIPCPDDYNNLILYRQYLRDFTKLDDWWVTENGIKTLEEFVKI